MRKWFLSLVAFGAVVALAWPAATQVNTSGRGIPLPVVNGQCIIGAGGVAVWGSCAGSGTAVTSVTGTAGQVTASPTDGDVILSLPATITQGTTFSGALVAGGAFSATNAVLTTPNIGTPSAATLTNATGLPIGTGVSGLGTGVVTFLGTPSGANLASALTTALPATKGGTGLTALGTGVATALAATADASGGICTVGGAGCTGGGSVSVTAGTPNVVITPSPGTGTFTVGTTEVLHDISGSGVAIVTGDATKTVLLGAFTYTLAQAGTTGFASGWGTCLLNVGATAATITTTTSVFKGAGGATSLSLPSGSTACPTSDGTDYVTLSASGSASTGTGSVVRATSPTLVTPTLGVASATTVNKVTLTAPASGSTLTIADGKTLTDTSGVGAVLLKGATGGGFAAAVAADVPATTLAAGTSVTLTAPREYYVCTGTCTVTPPVPAAGYEFCVMNDDNVATVITLAALGSSARYEATARTSYGTAGTGTLVSGGAAADKVCLVGRDSTHYLTASFNGTWTAN